MYKCCFPGCNYETDNRSLIEYHHIHLREAGNRLGKKVTIPLCPNHHDLIYHEEATAGQHAEKHPESMIVKLVTNTNRGKCVIFEDMQGNEHSVDFDTTPSDTILCLHWDLVHGITHDMPEDVDEVSLRQVDDYGFCDDGCNVYYTEDYETVAKALLSKHIAAYMEKAKSEFDSALERARSDWKALRSR